MVYKRDNLNFLYKLGTFGIAREKGNQKKQKREKVEERKKINKNKNKN